MTLPVLDLLDHEQCEEGEVGGDEELHVLAERGRAAYDPDMEEREVHAGGLGRAALGGGHHGGHLKDAWFSEKMV
jgi:hypothetical protein